MSKNALPDWVNLPEGYSGEMRENRIIVKNKDYPEFYMDIKISDGERNRAATFDAKLKEYTQSLEIYSEAVHDLKELYGFEFIRENDKLIAKIPEYDFEYKIIATNNSETAFKNLHNMEEALENKALDGVEKLEQLKKQGFTTHKFEKEASSSDVLMEISHEKLAEPVQITLRSELEIINNADMKQLDVAITAVNAPPKRKEDVVFIEPADTLLNFQEIQNHTPKPELDGKDKTSLVFDANAIFNLASPRKDGRSWLDILPITADLPNVEKIYIPAAVADWELRGGASYLDAEGKLQFHKIRDDTNINKNITGALMPAINDFMKDASHSVLDDSGHRHFIEGKNPNIVIYETEFDHTFLKGVREIIDENKDYKDNAKIFQQYKNQIKTQLSSITNIENCDIGEYAMEQVAKEVRENSDVFLVCDDNKYLQNRDSARHKSIAINEIGSKDFLVGTTSTYGFINAEVLNRGQEIKTKLEQQHGSLGVKTLTWNTIKGDIDKAELQSGGYPNSLCVGSKAGNRGMNHGKSLEEHINYGVSLQKNPEKTSKPSEATPNMIVQAAEIPYQESFGYKVGFHRIERRMSEEDLAEAIKNTSESQDKEIVHKDNLNANTVKDWEKNRTLPNKEYYEAIVKVLVDENEHIEEKDKNKVRQEFEKAYTLSQKARKKGSDSYEGEHGSDMFAFADVLSKYRSEAGLKEGKFSELLRKHLKFNIEEKPEEIDAQMMLNIGGNGYVPSFGLVRAMVKALDTEKELSPEEKQEIFDAYSAVKDKRVLTQSLTKDSTPELNELKEKMFKLFVKDGKQATMQQISYASEINSAALSQIFGKSSVVATKEKTLREREEKLADTLSNMTQDDDTVTLFKLLFESFIRTTNKQKSRAI